MTRGKLGILLNFDSRLSPATPNTPGRNSMEDDFVTADRFICKWDTNATRSMLFKSNREEARMYMDTVDKLHCLMEHLSAQGSSSTELIRAQCLMKMAMVRLEKEFHKILLSNSEPIDPDWWSSTRLSMFSTTKESVASSTRSFDDDDGSCSYASSDLLPADRIFDMVPLDAVLDLRNIARRMAKNGYGRECVRVFTLTRKSVVEESLYNLGVEKVWLSNARKMEWPLLDVKIKTWIYAAKISIRILFAREKWLCDEIFEGHNQMRDSCFAEIANDPTARLLAFAEAVAISSRAPERIFRILDLYETLTDLVPEMEATYCQDLFQSVHEQANAVLVRLGEAARGILTEFEKALEKENSKTTIAGGRVHPLTRYVMNYVSFLWDYKETLINLRADAPAELPKALPHYFAVDDDLDGPSALLSIRLGWTVFVLLCKLDTKSSAYKDVALSYVFLMNNLHYIVQKVKGSELKFMLGEEWLRKQWNKVWQYAANYEMAAWTEVLSTVTDERSNFSGGVSSAVALQNRMKEFNMAMEEAKRRHDGWAVPDIVLREKLRVSIAEDLMPAYNSFLGRYKSRFESDAHIKYTPEEVEDFLLNMFNSSPSSLNPPRSPIPWLV